MNMPTEPHKFELGAGQIFMEPTDFDDSGIEQPAKRRGLKVISFAAWFRMRFGKGPGPTVADRREAELDRAENDLFDAEMALESAKYDVKCLTHRVASLELRIIRLKALQS